MAKKNRTGLQSEVSHIFAGVPIPKKKRPRPEESEKKPENKDTGQTPAQQIPAKEQPATPETPPEKPSVTESPAPKEPTQQVPEKQKPPEATPIEAKPEIKPHAEVPEFKQPPLTQIPEEHASIPFSQAIELPEIDNSAGTTKEPSAAIKPTKPSNAGKSKEKTPRKTSRRPTNKRSASKSGKNTDSRKQTIMVILVIALSVLLFFLLFKPFSRYSNINGPETANPTVPNSSAQAKAASTVINWEIPDPYPDNIRDPMLLSSQQQFYSDTWKPNLVGLVYNEAQKYAIIGTEILQEGEEINGVTVVKINKDSVEFERNGQKWTQEVQSENN